MKCGFCNAQGTPTGSTSTMSGQRVVIIYCRTCRAILGAAAKIES